MYYLHFHAFIENKIIMSLHAKEEVVPDLNGACYQLAI